MNLTYTLEEISETADNILKNAKSRFLLFSGEMGTGKTTLIKEMVSLLGSNDKVSSPTFSLVNEYEGESTSIYHFDFYRIEDETEAYDMGFEDYLSSNHLVFIEWPEKIPNLWPNHYTLIEIEVSSIDSRRMIMKEF
ncbi:tRNA (adenosine(37)-N6)-threonylcarbamoyltransferase complex ATPase subunit type 1 TsaE [Psychroflexus tropicus]|uniref:tRNA (adenosine(37)-N6)-threonylcarbamoyltransferase complex ATPase subunit type 1 TsaE n=1 Tax=Psychroflexus tropicus TaxID=197345 RepID=UPI00036EF204|nr:tRNA (adenosine(37)-N6)-threonylcarbamoyltransferase complex ATPase subunit type 1 TsaE [Psychroflexus tropicus]